MLRLTNVVNDSLRYCLNDLVAHLKNLLFRFGGPIIQLGLKFMDIRTSHRDSEETLSPDRGSSQSTCDQAISEIHAIWFPSKAPRAHLFPFFFPLIYSAGRASISSVSPHRTNRSLSYLSSRLISYFSEYPAQINQPQNCGCSSLLTVYVVLH
jgi:hypothetical protein